MLRWNRVVRLDHNTRKKTLSKIDAKNLDMFIQIRAMLFKLVCKRSSSKFSKKKHIKCVPSTKKAKLLMKIDSSKKFSKNQDEQEKKSNPIKK